MADLNQDGYLHDVEFANVFKRIEIEQKPLKYLTYSELIKAKNSYLSGKHNNP